MWGRWIENGYRTRERRCLLMAWVLLIIAGAFEVVGVIGLNKLLIEKSMNAFLIWCLGFIGSFGLLTLAMNTLPLGVSYAIWTGIGTIGGTIVGIVFYGESKDKKRFLFIGMIVVAVIGLKLTA